MVTIQVQIHNLLHQQVQVIQQEEILLLIPILHKNGLSEVDNLEYLTNYTKNTNTNTSQSSATGQGTSQSQGSYAETKTGKDGTDSFMTLLNQYRDTFLNVDMEIIESLNSLFMNIY